MDNKCIQCGRKDIMAFAPPHLCGPCHFQARQEEKERERMGTERGNVLLEAHKIINGDRQQSYGNPEDTHQIIADLWNGYLDGLARTYEGDGIGTMCYPRLENTDVAHMMVLFKIARQINGAGKRDSVVDACGYMALSWDMSEEKERLCVAKHG